MRIAPPGKNASGFTLVELMIVMIIMAILSVAIIPEMTGSFQDALLKSTARKLVSACNLAYSTAISSNQSQLLRLLPEGRYIIESKGRTPSSIKEAPKGSTGELDARIKISVRTLEADSTLEEEQAPAILDLEAERTGEVIQFNPDGTADGRKIVLSDPSNFILVLMVNPSTSRVSISPEASSK